MGESRADRITGAGPRVAAPRDPLDAGSGRGPQQPQPAPGVLRGTLDLLVLKTLETLGPLHGYGIARRIEQVSEDLLAINQGTLYPALLRLEQRGWIRSEWGASENNRRARYYALTAAGRKQLNTEAQEWEQMAALMARVLAGGGRG